MFQIKIGLSFIKKKGGGYLLFVDLLENFSRMERLQIETYARRSRPLNIECSLACQTLNCDTGPQIDGLSERPVTLKRVAERLAVELLLSFLTTYLVCRSRNSNPDFPHARQTVYH